MNILVMGKEDRLKHYTEEAVWSGHRLTFVDAQAAPEEIMRCGHDAEVLLIDAMGTFSAEEMDAMPRLRLIHSEGVGFQGVDTAAAKERNIYVCNCKGANASAVAEQTLLLMLACLRNTVNCHEAVLAGSQITVKENYMKTGSIRELSDCVIGFIGFGDIARKAAALAAAFGAKCCYYDLFRAPAELEAGAEKLPLEEVLAKADIISLHLPVTAETKDFANAGFFEKTKDGAILINTARGELVDTDALIKAMQSGKIAMAGLDCIAGEPVKSDNPLLQAPEEIKNRLILSPHIAGITGSSFARSYGIFWSNVDRLSKGERPDCVVNGL